jgi:GT2 family glycosyltransferase
MNEDKATPSPDPEKSARKKSERARKEQIELAKSKLAGERKAGNQNPIVQDATYGELREDNRVVMRHQIALNIESFRAAPDAFQARPIRVFSPLTPVTSPFLSIIVPTLNGMRWLPTLMSALAAQTLRDFEVIVVDDGSTDATVAWLENNHPSVRLLVNRQNQGFVASCNMGADVARGRVIVFLNNDTEPDAGWAEALAKAICQNPQAGIFASKLLLFDRRDTLHSAGDALGIDGIPRNRGVWQQDKGQFDRQTSIFSGCGGAVAYRRELWTALDGFDESFWMYLEDTDFAFRAQLLGQEALFVPDARVYHHLSATGGGELASFYVGRNTIWMLAKNMPRHVLRRYGVRMIVAQAQIAWDALRNWRGAAARARLRGQIAGVVGVMVALRKRRVIQRRRLLDDRVLAAKLVDTQ